MKKTPAVKRKRTEETLSDEHGNRISTADALTPECDLCGEEYIGVTNDAFVILKGQFFPHNEFDAPVFMLDPDTDMRILQLPNGQLGLVTDSFKPPTKHVHSECFELMSGDFTGYPVYEEEEYD